MATTFSFLISMPKNRTALAKYLTSELHAKVEALENELTEFRETSPVYQLNHSTEQEWIPFTEKGFELLERALFIEKITKKAFSPLVKSSHSLPLLELDPKNLRVKKLNGETWLGFGAIGKGFALDHVRSALFQEGFEDFVLTAGGSSIVLSGFSDPSRLKPWSFGWSWQKDEAGDPLGVALSHETGRPIALGISGSHEKGNHIHDPRTREAVTARKSALVGSPSAADADAFSTALFIDGMEKTMTHLDEMGVEAATASVDENNIPSWNQLFRKFWGPLTALLSFVVLPVFGDEVVDLGDVPLNDFTPYVVERNGWWILLPLFALVLVAVHIKDSRPKNLLSNNPSEDPNEKTR